MSNITMRFAFAKSFFIVFIFPVYSLNQNVFIDNRLSESISNYSVKSTEKPGYILESLNINNSDIRHNFSAESNKHGLKLLIFNATRNNLFKNVKDTNLNSKISGSSYISYRNKPIVNLLRVPEVIRENGNYLGENQNYVSSDNETWDKFIDSFQDFNGGELRNYTWIMNYERGMLEQSWSDIISNLKNTAVFKTSKAVMDTMYDNIVPYVSVNMEEGRKMKLRRILFKSLLGMKMVAMGVFLPAVVALATIQSWKAVTISLLALGLATIVGIKNLISGITKSKSPSEQHHHHVHSSPPSWHSNDWGRSADGAFHRQAYNTISHWDRTSYQTPHDLAYSGYKK